MKKLFAAVKWAITLGPGHQNFLGASWIQKVLDRTPADRKRQRALQILSLSPHYFFCRNEPGLAEMPFNEYLNAAFEANRHSRQRIVDEIIRGRKCSDDVVLDFGCGPGFLARAIAPEVKRVYGYDISPGAIACARILNPADGLEYIDPADFSTAIPDEGVDFIVSLAVVQHLTDDLYAELLDDCWSKLKPGGRIALHVQLTGGGWRTEQEWRDDRSIQGRLRLKYGLHCFARPEEKHREIVSSCGYTGINVENIADLVSDPFDDICRQHLLSAEKPV